MSESKLRGEICMSKGRGPFAWDPTRYQQCFDYHIYLFKLFMLTVICSIMNDFLNIMVLKKIPETPKEAIVKGIYSQHICQWCRLSHPSHTRLHPNGKLKQNPVFTKYSSWAQTVVILGHFFFLFPSGISIFFFSLFLFICAYVLTTFSFCINLLKSLQSGSSLFTSLGTNWFPTTSYRQNLGDVASFFFFLFFFPIRLNSSCELSTIFHTLFSFFFS